MTPQDCLVVLMMAVSASDENILTAELVKIQSTVNNLPIFAQYDIDRLNIMCRIRDAPVVCYYNVKAHGLPLPPGYVCEKPVPGVASELSAESDRHGLRYQRHCDRAHSFCIRDTPTR